MVKKIETIKPAKNIVFIDKHLQKYQTRDILMTERNTLRYKRKSQIAQNTSDKYRNSGIT